MQKDMLRYTPDVKNELYYTTMTFPQPNTQCKSAVRYLLERPDQMQVISQYGSVAEAQSKMEEKAPIMVLF